MPYAEGAGRCQKQNRTAWAARSPNPAIASLLIKHDLQLDVAGARFNRAIERLDRILETEGLRYQRLEIDAAGSDKRNRAIILVRIAEDGLDADFLGRGGRDVEA